ncbi:DUF4179 domain-containing protein [Sporosarcina sp. Marseille-Q4943]|uniref:DUF4179 domain-containing protein n=1 Tax=Sporosarcina sp. Marseille-Q4943 TaxID=2942204 RepID=UPI00208DA663|nr:DUF4179 domain-containing protein [Sporosarcina sp. Marseille-Q4943]
MNCPTADKLSQFVDQLLPKQETAEIEAHVQSCTSCGKVVNAFQKEQRFIEETLQTPTLPENFTDLVLDQLEPYGKLKKQRKTVWKRVALTAAGVILAVSIGATVNPSFAQFIGGLFSSDKVDKGLNLAAEAGLTQKVDLQVEDQGLKFVVEEVIADTSRVSLSYKVLNENGIPQDTRLINPGNEITAIDQNGNKVNWLGTSWYKDSDYGYVEFNLHDQGNKIEKLMIQFSLVELNGVKGNWQLQVPVDLTENRKLTKLVDIKDASAVHHGVEINLKKLQIAPSSFGLFFETSLTEEEKTKYERAMREFEDKFGKDKMDSLFRGNTSGISYHIKNAEDEVIYSTRDMLRGTVEEMDKFGHTTWTHLYIPKNEDQLTFVLDGVYKKEATDIALTIKPKDLNKHPVSLDYKGNQLTVKRVIKPQFGEERSVIINLDGRINSLNTDLGSWIAVDDKGNSYTANLNGSLTEGEKSKYGIKARLSLELEGLKEVPDELTLYLVSMSFYYPVEEEWQVPLLGEN